jgi:hypothetical protein
MSAPYKNYERMPPSVFLTIIFKNKMSHTVDARYSNEISMLSLTPKIKTLSFLCGTP